MSTTHHRKSVLAGLLLGCLLLFGAVLQTVSAQAGDPLQFADPALEQAVRGQLIDFGPEELHASDVSDIERLYLEWPDEDEQIHSLEGIQALSNLTYLNLRGNSVTDLSPLTALENLDTVDMQSNQITELPDLGNLDRLENLNLASNQLSDISGLSGLDNLQRLDLSDNLIEDVEPLAGLDQLAALKLNGNAISDISALADLPNLFGLALFGNPELDMCSASPARAVANSLLAEGVDVLYQEYAAGGAPCPELADVEPLRITKTVAGQNESLLLQDGKLARLNPDGTRLVATCQGTARVVNLINEDKGVYWSGLFEEFARELSMFIPVYLLPDDPEVRYAVQIQVEEVGTEEILGHESRHYQVNWRPDAEEGGEDEPWQTLQEMWVSTDLLNEIAPSGCAEPAIMLEFYQLAQSTFSSQRFYGLTGSQEYGEAILSGFPVRVTIFGPGDTEPIETEVTGVDSEESPADLFTVPTSLERVNGIGQVF